MARLNLLEETRYEKLPVTVYSDQKTASIAVANRIAALIRKKTANGEKYLVWLRVLPQ
jgi:glucosamine-6-phosphate deaminase